MTNNWYEKLENYFPSKEMKLKEHFTMLLEEKGDFYKIDVGPHHILLYFEKADYLFIDYILITGVQRGKGQGSKLLERLKRKKKAIFLEVEPKDEDDPATLKRVKFYKNNGFRKISAIQYRRSHPITNEVNPMDIYGWAPERKSDEWFFSQMVEVYEEVHTYKAQELYGVPAEPVSEVLVLKKQIGIAE